MSLKASGKWTTTQKSSLEQSAGYTSDATLHLAGPAYGYNGITQVEVFWDSIYHTFAYDLYRPSGQPAAQGVVRTYQGKVVQFAPVSITVGKVTRRTFTDENGMYSFYELPPGGIGNVVVQGFKKQLKIGQPTATKADLVVKPVR